MKRQRRGVKYPVEKRTPIAPPPIFPGKDHRMQTNLSTIFPTIRHGSLNNAYANIRVPRFMEMGKKSASLFEAQRPILLFFFYFFFFLVSPHFFFLSPLSRQLAGHISIPPPPLPRNFQKAAQIQSCRLDFSIRNCTKWNHVIALHPSLSQRARLGRLSFDSGFVKNSKMIVPLVDFVPRQS